MSRPMNYNDAEPIVKSQPVKIVKIETLTSVSTFRLTQLRADAESASRKAQQAAIAKTAKTEEGTTTPIELITVRDGKKTWRQVISGFCRIAGWIDGGRKTIPARILPGTYTLRQAVAIAAGTNGDHGVSLTPADKRFTMYRIFLAVEGLRRELVDEKWVFHGTMPDGKALTLRALEALTPTGQQVSHTQFDNALKGSTGVFKHMCGWNEDDTADLKDPRTYKAPTKKNGPKKEAAKAAKEAGNSVAAAETALEEAAQDSEANLDFTNANVAMSELEEARQKADAAAKNAAKARKPETIKEHADSAKEANKEAGAALGRLKEAVEAAQKASDSASKATRPKTKGQRQGIFFIHYDNPEETAQGIALSIMDTFDGKNKVKGKTFLNAVATALMAAE